MSEPCVLAIDIGSSSVRAGLFDLSGNAIPRSSVREERSFDVTPGGGSEMDADKCVDRVSDVLERLLRKNRRHISHAAISTIWHSLLGVNEKGKPTTKVLGWADRRSREYTNVLQGRFNERVTHARTGAHFHSSFWTSKLLWLRSECPEVWDRTDRWLSLADYLSLRLFGSAETSVSMASATGIFDQAKCDWDTELIRYLKVKRASLPAIATEGHTFKLLPKYARRWPQLRDTRWFPAIGDGAADNVGSGCLGKGRAALMVGTSAAMRTAYRGNPPKRLPAGLWCYRIDRERVIVGGALSDGGNLYELIKNRFGLGANAEAMINGRESADGLVVIPFFHGERSTGYDENARGAIVGMNAEHDGVDILRAAMEGVAFRLLDIYERLNRVAKIDTIVASGGALAASPVWRAIIAEVLGRELTLSDSTESSSRGAVLLALEKVGKIKILDQD